MDHDVWTGALGKPQENQDDEDMVEEILNRRPSSMNQPRTDNFEEYGENVAMANRDDESGGSAAAHSNNVA